MSKSMIVLAALVACLAVASGARTLNQMADAAAPGLGPAPAPPPLESIEYAMCPVGECKPTEPPAGALSARFSLAALTC